MSDCIRWWQYIDPLTGYGQLGKQRWASNRPAHRFIWEECFGAIPEGATIHHTCSNRACVNPEHLHLCRDRLERAEFLRERGHEYKAPPREALPIELTGQQATQFWFRVQRVEADQCWEWTGESLRNGYGRLGGLYTHRIAYTLAVGAIPDGLYVCHHCDNRRCCNPAHLFLATAAENSRDMAAKGRARGGMGTVRTFDHDEARALHHAGVSAAEIARRFGVSRSGIIYALRASA